MSETLQTSFNDVEAQGKIVLFKTYLETGHAYYGRFDRKTVNTRTLIARIQARKAGTNELNVQEIAGFLKEDDFKRIYAEMLIGISRSSPKTKIIAQSILPLSDKSVKYYKKLTKEAVVKANGWIEEVCGDLGVDYLPTHDLLTDDNGYLKTEYQNDEYLHLTSAAYEIILKNLENHISNNIDEFK